MRSDVQSLRGGAAEARARAALQRVRRHGLPEVRVARPAVRHYYRYSRTARRV